MLGSVMAGAVELGTAYAVAPTVGSVAGWQEEFIDVTSPNTYQLAAMDGTISIRGNDSNLTRIVRKSKASETIYINLSGDLSAVAVADFQQTHPFWKAKAQSAPDGTWADISLNWGPIAEAHKTEVLAIKSYCFPYYYYKGASDILSAVPIQPETLLYNDIYIPANADYTDPDSEIPVKWRMFNANVYNDDNNPLLGILLWSDDPLKVLRFEVESYQSYAKTATKTADIVTFVINYKNVKW
jgi:hypothetical protein